ncbi:hypothetical protein Rsub_09810 [Raphidocelis subcapitata]|uniref:Uncharacterized protein n=1 Tax=Raphidocelis subcapitata TaxID=307507 RepID=A0A2V0PGH8_9CHLO|nr:hypothetical protein Rsub_09810 [Raphidocelis subcapitata]|eukprot:GBF97013.1 hypothetical protein Rsub_09810 [Raphidocelis subcapitata]
MAAEQQGSGWARWAAGRLGLRPGAVDGAGAGARDDTPPVEFVYGRVSADSSDEEEGPYGAHPPRCSSAPPEAAGSGHAHGDAEADGERGSFSGLAAEGRGGLEGLSEVQRRFGEALAADVESDLRAEAKAAAVRLRSGSGFGGTASEGGGAGPSSSSGSGAPGADAAAEAAAAAGAGSEDDEAGAHAAERRELLIFALPLARGKVVFLPVVPWRQAPEPEKRLRRPRSSGSGGARGLGALRGMLRQRMATVADDATDLWSSLKEAEEGTLKNRIFRVGQRVLDGISAEERLMRGLPRKITRVIIFHPSQVPAASLSSQMSTMTSSYGLAAASRAAAATLLLPLAIGVDLIILPGPQVLTYYTSWEIYRNAQGLRGTQRAAYVTQATGGSDIRVEYVADTRLDAAHDATSSSRDGVMPEEAIGDLVAALKEPSLEEPLRELRRQQLRKTGRAAADSQGRYAPLPAADEPGAAEGGSHGGGGGGSSAGGGSAAKSVPDG